MINFDDVFGENIKEDNANWLSKANALLNLINISLILIRVYTLNIYMKQNINCYSTNARVYA